jgi:hypothetical protein
MASLLDSTARSWKGLVLMRVPGFLKRRSQSSMDSSFSILLTTTTAILAIASVALIGWGTHVMLLASWLGYAVPIAPLVAQLFIVFALFLLADALWPSRAYLRLAMAFAALCTIFKGVHVLLRSSTSNKVAELFFIQHMRVYPAQLVREISPYTRIGFVLASIFLLLCAIAAMEPACQNRGGYPR